MTTSQVLAVPDTCADALRIHDLWFGECPLLGPSLYVWVQGCPRRCRGCFNQSALDREGPARVVTPEEVAAEWMAVDGAGLVLSGGEPFSQAAALARVCRVARAVHPETPVLTYTGYEIGEILTAGRRDWLDLLSDTDVLVDGPFVEQRQTDHPLVGSDNQHVFFFSQRVSPVRLNGLTRSRIQVTIDQGRQLRIVGTGTRDLSLCALVDRLRTQGLVIEG